MPRPPSLIVQTGVSLLEVMIALLVLSIGLVSLARFQGIFLRYNDLAQQQADAVVLGTKKIEALRNAPVYSDITSGTEIDTVGGTAYTLAWSVTQSTAPDYKTVTLTATWSDRQGTAHTITLSTHIGKIDPAASGLILRPH